MDMNDQSFRMHSTIKKKSRRRIKLTNAKRFYTWVLVLLLMISSMVLHIPKSELDTVFAFAVNNEVEISQEVKEVGLVQESVAIKIQEYNNEIANKKKLEAKIIAEQNKIKSYAMPTVDEVSYEKWNQVFPDKSQGYIRSMRARFKGTDKHNDLIVKVCLKYDIDPEFAKTIMIKESSGHNIISKPNTNGSRDWGLMQVNDSCWSNYNFDYQRMLEDEEYAIECGVICIVDKINYAKHLGLEPTAFNVLWLYNGYSEQGRRYAEEGIKVYNLMPNRDSNFTITIAN